MRNSGYISSIDTHEKYISPGFIYYILARYLGEQIKNKIDLQYISKII